MVPCKVCGGATSSNGVSLAGRRRWRCSKCKKVTLGEVDGGRNLIRAPRELRDMRHVYSRSEEEDQTEGQKRLRELWKRKPDVFLRMKATMEGEFRKQLEAAGAPGGAQEAAKVELSAVEVSLVEQIDRLLKELGV